MAIRVAVCPIGGSGPVRLLLLAALLLASLPAGAQAQVPGIPSSLRQCVTASTVTLSWLPPNGEHRPTYYRITVGTRPGGAEVGSYNAGPATTLTLTLPNGADHARVAAGNAIGTSAESSDTPFAMGTPNLPGTPGKPVVHVNGLDITVTFAPSVCGPPATSFVIQAGTTPGAINLGEHPIGLATTVATRVATGFYYVRVVAVGTIGRSAASVETEFDVGMPGQPGTPVVTVNGTVVTLVITPPSSGALPAASLIQAGTTPDGRQLGLFNVGRATAVTATLGAGRYFVRTLGVNGSGQQSKASPEVEFSVLGDGSISTEAAGDIIAHNQSLGIFSYRIPGFITRWELPVPVHVDPSMDINLVTRALELWKSWTGVTYTFVPNVEPRLLVRIDGTLGYINVGGIDGTYSNNQARSGFAFLAPLSANSFDAVAHELGHALGIFDHPFFSYFGSGGRISPREAALLRSLYQVPHGAKVLPNGTWEVPALLPPGPVRWEWRFGSGSTISFTWSPPPGGTPADYILEIGTAPGLSDHAVVTTTSLSTSVALVPGTYYARVKARNASGTGPSAWELPVSFTVYPADSASHRFPSSQARLRSE